MKKRIYRNTVFIVLASLLIFSVILAVGLYFVFSEAMQEQLDSELELLVIAVEASEDSEALYENWSGSEGTSRLTLIDASGNVIFDSETDANTMENHLSRPEVSQALEEGYGSAKRISSTLGELTLYVAQRLSDGCVLRLSYTQNSILGVLIGMLLCFILATPFAMAASSVLAGRTTRAIMRPIDELDLEHPSDNNIYDEFAPLLSRMSMQNRKIDVQMRELERKRKEFEGITEHMSEGLVICNARGEILTINQSARKIFRVGDADHTGQYVLSLHRSTEMMNVIRRAEEGESSSELLRVNGRVLQLMASPVEESGMTTGILLLIPDVTDRVEAEQNRREFSANVSHELKTPLTSIMGYAELMKSGMVPEEDMPRFAEQIYEAAQRLLQLVEDIIHLSRLDEGAPAEMESVDLAQIARNVCERLQHQAEEAGLKLELDVRTSVVEAVPHMVDELITNLVDNSIKYNRPDGKIRVKVRSDGQGGRVSVRDTGIGIAPEDQEKIFERFYRVDKSRSGEIRGTGLGLSLVKHIAAYHHARIHLDSELGRGTSISVWFPARQPED